jgi:hypothetical protein
MNFVKGCEQSEPNFSIYALARKSLGATLHNPSHPEHGQKESLRTVDHANAQTLWPIRNRGLNSTTTAPRGKNDD